MEAHCSEVYGKLLESQPSLVGCPPVLCSHVTFFPEKESSLLLLFIVSLLAQEVYSGEKENQITEKRVPFVVVYGLDS